MKSYVQELKLSFDPFDASAISRGFFEGGNRREIRDQIVERAMYSESLISVSGCLGSGKSSLLAAITQSFGEEAVVVNIAATLFMSSDQFMDQLVGALQLPGEFESLEDRAHAVTHLAGQLQMDARSLLIQVDDAHDLGGEVLKYLVALKKGAAADSVHVILFGESQMGRVLESTLEHEQLAILAEFDLGGFGSEATHDYIRFKLKGAGYTKLLPLEGSVLGAIHNSSNGMPGAINSSVHEALTQEFGVDVAADVRVPAEVEAVGVEFGTLEAQFGADVAAQNTDYTDDELAEFSTAREVDFADLTLEDTSTSGRYFAAASILLVVLVAAFVLLQTGQEVDSAVVQISVPASASVSVPMPATIPQGPSLDAVSLSTIAQRPRGSADLNPAETKTAAASVLDASEPSSIIRDEPEPNAEVASAAVVIVAKPELGSEPLELLSSVRNTLTGSVVRTPEPVAEVSNSSELSSFEQNLLSYPSTNYTVQIVGSSSESSIQAFVPAAQLSSAAGYFETRLNGKPWYVVIAGNFSNKEAAAAFLLALPDSAKTSGPWVRSIRGIQSDIQKLQQQP
jgi:DamX protein|tara:strand:+ start:852 stop:2558 length:1707 start_codon:yes stop_codon:yes gene_type:complete